jgi:hypothetical protein
VRPSDDGKSSSGSERKKYASAAGENAKKKEDAQNRVEGSDNTSEKNENAPSIFFIDSMTHELSPSPPFAAESSTSRRLGERRFSRAAAGAWACPRVAWG